VTNQPIDSPFELWEATNERRWLSVELIERIDAMGRLVRVSHNVDTKIRTKHAASVHFSERFDDVMSNVRELFQDRDNHLRWEVMSQVGDRWALTVIERTPMGVHNLVCLYHLRDSDARRRIARRKPVLNEE
jgi:hypothetical protein